LASGRSVCVLAGGVGAARLLAGLVRVVDPSELVAVVNVGDDETLHGLRISPDLDTITYTLAGAIDPLRGWGLSDETWQAMESLRRYTASVGRDDLGWFNLGDRDLGTHLYRTSRLAEGAPLSAVTAEIVSAWGLRLRLLPVSDDPVATRLVSDEAGELAFQEYFVRHQHGVAVREVSFSGAEAARPAPGVLEAIAGADVVVIAPSNPIVSIGPLLAVPGVREAVVARRDRCVAVSPIVGGKALKGPADRLLAELGHESSARGVARIYRDLASVLVVDTVDAALAPSIEAEGARCVVAPSIMSDPEAAAALARVCLDAVPS
jgi:LPPG:FO 2-phospho-L-lactate transferase